MGAWENLKQSAGESPPKSSWERLREAARTPAADRQEQSAIAAEQAHKAAQTAAATTAKRREGQSRPVTIPMPQQVETKPATPVSTPKAAQRSGNYNLQSLPDLGREPSRVATIEKPIKSGWVDERVWDRQISIGRDPVEKPKISTLPLTKEPPALTLLSATVAANQQEGRSRPTAVSTSKQRNKQSSLATERADEADKMMVPSESRQRQQALATERADEADKMLVPSASRQAAQSTTTSSAKSQEGRSRPVEIPMEQITQAELEIRQKSAASAQTVNPGTSAKDYTAMADALEAEAKELFKEYSALTSAPRRGATANLAENRQEAARKLREYDEKQQEVKRLRELAAEAEAAEEQQKLLSYQDFLKNPDYAEKSQYKSTANGKEAKLNAWSGMYTETGFNDITYDYINGNKDAREKQMVNDISTNASLLGLDKSFLDEMTDAEVGLFNYVYATQGADEAYRFVKQLETNLTYRQRIKNEAEAAQYAAEHPVASSVLSVIESPMKGLGYIGQLADYADDGKIDQNAGYNKYSYTNNAIRGQVSQIAEEKWGKPGSFLYNTGMSMGDFLFTTAITGGQEALSLAIMGTSAAADATIAAKDRGLSDDQAFAIGAIAGAAEIVTEKVSLDTLLDKTSLSKNAAGYFFKNMLAEGSEEVTSDLINLLADVAISKDKSEWRASVRAYMDQGMTEKEATGMAFADQAKSMGLDFLGGALSGGVMSGSNIVLNQATTKVPFGEAAARLTSDTNMARYRSDIDAVFKGEYPSGRMVVIGDTPEVLLKYGAKQHSLTFTPDTAYKIAYPEGYFGGKHNLGMSVLKQLPYQIADPVAILKSKTQENSFVLLTEWKDGDQDVIIPIHLDRRGAVGLENRIPSAYGKTGIDILLGEDGENILYTRNSKDIHRLLSKGVQFPQAMADDILAKSNIPETKPTVKPTGEGSWVSDILSYANALRKHRGQASASYADTLREILQSASQQDTPYSDALRRILDELGGFREP